MKLKMKKLVSLGLVSAMSLTMLAGCGNSNGATNDTGADLAMARPDFKRA